MRVVESLNAALHEAMSADGDLVLVGEDVLDPYGGAFKVTRGLSDAFPDRVWTMPISEGGLVGMAIGMAIEGTPVVAEIMFGDFLTLATDQLVNHAAKFRWMYNDQVEVPLVVRAPMGGGRGYGPTHSQSLEKHFCGVPGLTVVATHPYAHPGDLLRRSLASRRPTLLVENKVMYARPVMPADALPHPSRPDVVILAYGGSVEPAAAAARRLGEEEEIATGVIAIEQLWPFPADEIVAAIAGCTRVLVVEEGAPGWGFAAECARAHRAGGPVRVAGGPGPRDPLLAGVGGAGSSRQRGDLRRRRATLRARLIMGRVLVETPRANANEDQLQLISAPVSAEQRVTEGDLLFVLETTKAAIDVLAPASGIVRGIQAAVGDFVTVGTRLCEIVCDGGVDGSAEPAAGAAVARNLSVAVTAKARRIAEELGVDIGSVPPIEGRIGEAEVRAAHRWLATTRAARHRWAEEEPSSRRAVIVGGGGHAACLADALSSAGYLIEGCVDRSIAVGNIVHQGVPVLGDEGLLEQLFEDGVRYAFIGVGGAESSQTRRMLFERLCWIGFEIPSIIDPSARIASGVSIGRGCHILAGATIGPRCRIGDNVVVNQGSIVCHDCTIHDHVHLTPGAILAGGITVGPRSVVGMGATLLLGITVGADCLIHNGAHLVADVDDNMVVDAGGRRTLRSPVSMV